MGKIILSFLFGCFCSQVLALPTAKGRIRIMVTNEQKVKLPQLTVYLLDVDSVAVFTGAADSAGMVERKNLAAGRYRAKASQQGYETGLGNWIELQNDDAFSVVLVLSAGNGTLANIFVVATKQFIQYLPDKTVINPEANITNAGAAVMEILEKSPGISVSKDGSIIMKGKPSVLLLIDGKPTQLSGADLQAYLGGMSASQIVVELI